MTPRKKVWSKRELEYCRQAINSGKSAADVAAFLHLPYVITARKLDELQSEMRAINNVQTNEIDEFIRNHDIKRLPPQAVAETQLHKPLTALPAMRYDKEIRKYTRQPITESENAESKE